MLGLSNASGMFDITGTMWMVAIFFIYGVKSVFIPWLWPVWNQVFLMIFLAVWMRRSNVLTGAEWLNRSAPILEAYWVTMLVPAQPAVLPATVRAG